MAAMAVSQVSSGVMKESITYPFQESKSFLAVGKPPFQNCRMDGWQVRKQARIRSGLTQDDIGKRFDPPISRVAVGHWEKAPELGGNAPDPKKLKILSEIYGLTAGQLLGQEPVNFNLAKMPQSDYAAMGEKYVTVQKLSNELGLGYREMSEFDEIDGRHAFRRDWIVKNGWNVEDLRVVDARGDSQTPYINDGDVVLVNIKRTRIVDGEYYALRTADGSTIKRCFRQMDGKVRLEALNAPTDYLTPDRPGEVMGEVVYRAG